MLNNINLIKAPYFMETFFPLCLNLNSFSKGNLVAFFIFIVQPFSQSKSTSSNLFQDNNWNVCTNINAQKFDTALFISSKNLLQTILASNNRLCNMTIIMAAIKDGITALCWHKKIHI